MVFVFILDNKDAIESAAEKPSCPAFLSWHTVWPAQVRAEEHKLHSHSVAHMVPQEKT